MEIKPMKSFNKTIRTAPDKSITHRALMFNALCEGEAVIKNALLGLDCVSTIDCVRALGASVDVEGDNVRVRGVGEFKDAMLDVGNSGTTIRLFSGILSARNGKFTIDGDASIRRRPMKRVIVPLSEMGADIVAQDGCAPLTITGHKLRGITYEMPVASAQVKSAILLAGLNADGPTTVVERAETRNHTELMLQTMGARIEYPTERSVRIHPGRLTAADVDVPGDISSAAFPLVLAAITKNGYVKIENLGINPTRTGILDVLSACGAKVIVSNRRSGVEPIADVEVMNGDLKPFALHGAIIPRLIDEIPALAVLACFAEGKTVISGAAELKVKESNRIDAVVRFLSAFGADIEATDDGMIINGKGGLRGGVVIDPLGDHRIAMAAAVAGAAAKRGATVLGASAASVSYPGFYEQLFGEHCSGE